MTVTGVDMNRDGIPDALQQQQYTAYAAPASYAAPATQYASYAAPATQCASYAAPAVQYAAPAQAYYAAPAATATVTGVDYNRDGIPDVLQQQQYATYSAPASFTQV